MNRGTFVRDHHRPRHELAQVQEPPCYSPTCQHGALILMEETRPHIEVRESRSGSRTI